MHKKPVQERMVGKFKKYAHFWFFIPTNRQMYGWDFFVNQHNYWKAVDGDSVEAIELMTTKWKKPEARIIHVVGTHRTGDAVKPKEDNSITGIYVEGGKWYGFINVVDKEKGYYVHERNKKWAQEWDTVRATLSAYKTKEEALITEIISADKQIITWIYSDNPTFWFVKPLDKSEDIFIAGPRKGGAKTGDTVEVQILRKWFKKLEGKVVKILPKEEKKPA
jgi:exoribonuclease R